MPITIASYDPDCSDILSDASTASTQFKFFSRSSATSFEVAWSCGAKSKSEVLGWFGLNVGYSQVLNFHKKMREKSSAACANF